MAMTFNAEGCKNAASKLSTASNTLNEILNTSFKNNITKVQCVYQSDTANELYNAYSEIEKKFPEFINAIKECSEYLTSLSNKYAEIEEAAKSKVQG